MPPLSQLSHRLRLAAAALVVILLGLLSRTRLPMPSFIAAYGGDTLYATLVCLLLRLAWPSAALWHAGLLALGICAAIELSQLYHTPWLDAARATLPGRLILGSGFLWSDLVCYAVGVALGVLIAGYWLQPPSQAQP